MTSLTILVSKAFAPEHLVYLRNAFPKLCFVQMDTDGIVPTAGRSARVLLRGGMYKDELAATVQGAPSIDWIHTSTAGFDWVLIPEVIEKGITVTRSADTKKVPLAEFAIACIFLFAKRFPRLLHAQQRRTWLAPESNDVTGSTVGIIGVGAIGTEVAQRVSCLGMKAIGIKRTPAPLPHFDEVLPPTELPTLLRLSDYVLLACPLTPETRGMIGAKELQTMKPTSYLINVARGGLVVEMELVQALKEGWIAGACLDAFESEPLPPDSPLWNAPNLIVTPHCAYSSPRNLDRVLQEFVGNLELYLKGEPLKWTPQAPELGY
jgi:phosphoglycerate dehydrogenase-like enzyme